MNEEKQQEVNLTSISYDKPETQQKNTINPDEEVHILL